MTPQEAKGMIDSINLLIYLMIVNYGKYLRTQDIQYELYMTENALEIQEQTIVLLRYIRQYIQQR